jgi:Trk K+ transport system NAD-binding subunit
MRIIVLGAGDVGRAIVDALHQEHDITVIDFNAEWLAALSAATT